MKYFRCQARGSLKVLTNKNGAYIVTGIVDKRVEAYRCGKPDIQLKCNNSDFSHVWDAGFVLFCFGVTLL